MSGRADLWFFDNIGAPKIAREAGLDPDSIEEIFTYQTSYSYIAFSRQTSEATVSRWQNALDEMKADGTFRWIAGKWLPVDAILSHQGSGRKNRPSISPV